MLQSTDNNFQYFSLVKIQKKIKSGLSMLHYFSISKWDFKTDFLEQKRPLIENRISNEEKEIFYIGVDQFDISEYLKNCILGGRQYCLKEPPSSIPKARTHLKM